METFQSNALARAVFEEVGDALFLFDPDSGRVLDVNAAGQRLSGFALRDLVKLLVTELFSPPRGQPPVPLRPATPKSPLAEVGRLYFLRTPHARIWIPVSLTVAHVPADCNPPRRLGLITARDAREEHWARKKLQRLEADYRRTLAAVGDCVWTAGVDSHGEWLYRFFSPTVRQITGRRPQAYLGPLDRWKARVHPEDRPRWQEALANAQRGRPCRLEYRFVRRDGTVRWVRERIEATFSADEKPTRLHGVLSDITEQKELERLVRAGQEQLRAQEESLCRLVPAGAPLLHCRQGHSWQPPADLQTATGLHCPVCGADALGGDPATIRSGMLAADTVATASIPVAPLSPTEVAPVAGYRLVEVLGRGGMGVVYKAQRANDDRPVALKMLPPGTCPGPDDLARLRREAEAIARLQHPNFVQIYEVGTSEGRPYLALEFVDGESLAARLSNVSLAPREAAALLETLARGVEAAHERGVVHRDLKPANILLANGVRKPPADDTRSGASRPPLGGITPKITDFGLAKLLESDAAQTRTGAILGTPGYMAPEQVGACSGSVGRAADVYALGAILYECLTGRPPFRAASLLETLEQVRTQEAVPPRRLQPGIPRDLETICLKCLEKEPHKRYATAAALAEDLHRFQSGAAIRARPVGIFGRLWRWTRRNPVVAGLLVALTLVLAGGFGLVTWKWRDAVEQRWRVEAKTRDEEAARARAEEAERAAQRERAEAEQARRQAERRQVRLVLERGQALAEQGDVGPAMLWLAQGVDLGHRAGEDGLERALRRNLAGWRSQLAVPGLRLQRPSEVRALAFCPDGKHVLLGYRDGFVCPWDLTTGGESGPRLENPGIGPFRFMMHAVAVSRDGKTAVTGGSDGAARVWDLATGRQIGPLLAHRFQEDVWAVAFSPEGRTVLTGCADGTARFWSADGGKPLGEPLLHGGAPVSAVAYSPDGKTVVTGTWGGKVHLWNAATHKAIHAPLRHSDRVLAVAFSPDGRSLLTGCRDGAAQFWDVASGTPIGAPLQQLDRVATVAYSPDGGTVLVGSGDGVVRLWDVVAHQPVGPVFRHESAVRAAAFSPDGKSLVVGCLDGTAQLWQVPERKDQGTPFVLRTPLHTVAFSADGRMVLTGSRTEARLWGMPERQPIGPPMAHSNTMLYSAALSPDGRILATASWDHTVRLWDTATGQLAGAPLAHDEPVLLVRFHPNGRTLLSVAGSDEKTQVFLWDLAERRRARLGFLDSVPVLAAAYSPDGRLLLTCGQNRTAQLWDPGQGRPVSPPLRHPDWVLAGAFAPDGRHVVTGCRDGSARLWDVRSDTPVGLPFLHRGPVTAVAFSPDGETLLTGSGDRTARLWDLATATPLGPPLRHRDAVTAVAFSPDGRTLLTGGKEGIARLWRPPAAPLTDPVGQILTEVRLWTALDRDTTGTAAPLTADAPARTP
jgi:PAS domain S-box-containing protein